MIAHMVYEYFKKEKTQIKNFTPFPKANDRTFWKSINNDWQESNLKNAKSYIGFNFLPLSASDFLEFTKTGNRVNYENKLFEKRVALSALVIGECIEHKGNFIEDIVNGIFSICEESAWFLPAHNTYIRDAVQLPLPDSTNPVLELFSCETGAILSTTLYLLEDELNEVSPFIAKRIRHEINNRIIKPYLNCHFWWMGKGDEPMCNWTIWCTQNVLISAFLSGDLNSETLIAIIEKAAKSSDFFLKDYGDDGCCEEGAQYYRHSGLCLYNVIDILDKVTGDFFGLFEESKIKNIAVYIMYMHVCGPYYFNFADCSPVAGRAGAREYLFADAINNRYMKTYAAIDYMDDTNSLTMPSEHNLYYRIQNGVASNKIIDFYNSIKPEIDNASANKLFGSKEIYYPSTGIFITNDNHLSVAVKAGNNGDSHNHNDTGSFTVYADGKPFIIDIGVETYTKKTFSDRRYEIWTMQSSYHNLPTIDGNMQLDGKDYCAQNISYDFGDNASSIQMDISKAYPQNIIQSYIRKVTLNKGSDLCVEDSFENGHNVLLSIMTYDKPIKDNNIISIGNLGSIELTYCKALSIEECPINDARLAQAWKHSVYRILIKPNDDRIKLIIRNS